MRMPFGANSVKGQELGFALASELVEGVVAGLRERADGGLRETWREVWGVGVLVHSANSRIVLE
ncbi:hypothetical protein BH23CHL5_BH23CHL5_27380 [soil metagenome]